MRPSVGRQRTVYIRGGNWRVMDGGDTGGEGSFTQWVHCEFVVSFEAIRPSLPSRYVVSSFKKYPPKYPLGTF